LRTLLHSTGTGIGTGPGKSFKKRSSKFVNGDNNNNKREKDSIFIYL